MVYAHQKKLIALIAGVYALAVLFSVYCLLLKRDALQFHTRDYNYFVEQAARLADPQLSDRFSLNIEGYNFLGLQGTEGVGNLFHAIHTEYFRYTYVILYGLFRSTLPLYIFYSLLYFLPILYFAVLPRPQTSDAWKPVLLFSLLFILIPATLDAVTADLRPRMLFPAAWSLVSLAVFYDRPFLEKLVFFGLLLGIREEGIVLGLIVIAFNFLRLQGKPGRWMQTLVFLFLDAAAFAAFLAFMAWGHYNRVDVALDPRRSIGNLISPNLPVFLGGLFLVALLLGFFWFRKREHFTNILLLLVYSTAIPLAGIPTANDILLSYTGPGPVAQPAVWDVYLEFVTNSSVALVFCALILLLVVLLDFARNSSRKILLGVLSFLCVVFAATTLATSPQEMSEWRQNIPRARLVWDFVESHDSYRTNVLVDYETYQAFYNYENVIVYNRLPLWLTEPDKRYYPKNKDVVARLIEQRLEYAVIATSSLEDLRVLARLAGVPVTEMAANDRYTVLKLR